MLIKKLLRTKNIRVINAVEGAMNAVAELVLGFMLSLGKTNY